MDVFSQIYRNPLRNIVNVKRYSGMFTFKVESVPDHCSDMFAIALAINSWLVSKGHESLDMKDVAYRIFTHDLDEAVLCDVPRSLKYLTDKITDAIKEGVDEYLEDFLDAAMISDISNAKSYSSREGFIIKVCDLLQARFKLYEEVVMLKNGTLTDQLLKCKGYVEGLIINKSVPNLDQAWLKDVKSLVSECVLRTNPIEHSSQSL